MGKSENKSSGFNSLVWVAIIAAFGLLAIIAIPNFIKARSTSAINACINNLRQIDSAKQQWALEYKKTAADVPTWNDIKSFLGRGDGIIPKCPLDGTYILGALSNTPTCSLGTNVTPAHVLE